MNIHTRKMIRLPWIINLAVLAVLGASCGQNKQSDITPAGETELDKQQIADLAKHYRAVVDWRKSLRVSGLNPPFTYDLKRALIQSNGAPVLLVMTLEDVNEVEGHLQAKFSRLYMNDGLFQLALNVNCTPDQANELLEDRDRKSHSYAIVAHVTRLERPNFFVNGVGGVDNPRVELNTDSNVFWAEANCEAAVRLKTIFWMDE